MTEAQLERIPVHDISTFTGDPKKDLEFADEVGSTARNVGFMAVVGHDVGVDLTGPALEAMQRVFVTGMTLEQRQQYEFPLKGRQMGYTTPGTEYSVGHTRPNQMEFWHVTDPASPVENVFPTEVPEFGPLMLKLHAALKQFGQQVLRVLAIHLRRDPEFFVEWTKGGENLLRTIHYPPLQGDEPVERSGGHTDINLITVMVPATEPGLQVQDREGRWIDANNPPGSLIVNLGDMLAMHTFGELPSTPHRVVKPSSPSPSRFSMPMFIHPNVERTLVRAGAFKMRRLREINLVKKLPYPEIDY